MASVFISHSSSDKPRFVQPLVDVLRAHRHVVWYDTESITLTDSIPLTISEGLDTSDCGLVVISRPFLDSPWCRRELAALIMGHTNSAKRLLIVQLDGAPVPPIIADIKRISVASADLRAAQRAIDSIRDYLADAGANDSPREAPSPSSSSRALVDVVLEANATAIFGANLLTSREPISSTSQPGGDGEPYSQLDGNTRPENEGLILIKPGGTFHKPCLLDLFRRITRRCTVLQVRLFDGHTIRERRLFEKQYATPTSLARGHVRLTSDDIERIHEIYDTPDFKRLYHVPYSDDLIAPALTLTDTGFLDAKGLQELWEMGRIDGRFHNNRANGLNKIGYQKSVLPIDIPRLGVRLVLNGFIPGYRELFEGDSARTVAIHVRTGEPWQAIRDQLAGGNSDPRACAPGSIRYDAADGKIPLDPTDFKVNGQRNVCHSSATLFDGMRELCDWFEYMPKDTIVGQVCFLSGVDPLTLTRFLADELPDISWDTRDTNLMQLLFEVRLRIVKDNLRGGSAFARRVADYSASVDERADLGDLIGQSPALSAFVVDGLRLTSAGDELYQQAVGKVFPEKVTARVFLEIVRSIQQIARERGYVGRPEIVAAAYRIAASDLMFLKCPAYESLDSPQLFRSTVIGELPEQALECGARTEANLIRDLRGKYSVPTPGGNVDAGRATAVKITQHPEWSRLRSMRGRVSTRASTVAIVLAGGRSTRLASTIPKPVLPFRSKLLVSWVEDAIRSTTGGDVDIFLGVGFRDDLIRKALGNRVRYLRYEKTLGPGFRVAAALEMLAGHEGRVVVIYADVPGISPATIDALLSAVSTERTFGLVESYSDVSGYILKRDGRIVEIVQSRLRPPPAGTYTRDAGAYAFRNTEEFRGILGSVRNNNVRGEFMFADVVAGLARRGWDIRAVSERPSLARGINTPAELLALACGVADTSPATRTELSQMHATLADDYLLRTVSFESFEALNAAIGAHVGPLYFFRWWDALWS